MEEDWQPSDTSGLTDADWAEINKLRRAHESGGERALLRAIKQLRKDPVRYTRVIGAYYPEKVREALKDAMADAGMTREDLQDLLRKSGGAGLAFKTSTLIIFSSRIW